MHYNNLLYSIVAGAEASGESIRSSTDFYYWTGQQSHMEYRTPYNKFICVSVLASIKLMVMH